ncbi:MAG: ribbon-helix-helix domain-containing protein [Planctomycetota bacterium]
MGPQERARDAGNGSPERKPFLLRLPPELMEELRVWANQDLRSLNGHIEFLLRRAVEERGGSAAARARGKKK